MRTVLLWYVIVLAGLSQVAWLATHIRGSVGGRPYPSNTFLFAPHARFTDFTIFESHFKHFGEGPAFFRADPFPFTYPPVTAYAFLPFMKAGDHSVAVYSATIIAAAMLLGTVVCARGRRYAGFSWVVGLVLITSLLSYPLLFLIDRANIEGVVWILLASGLIAYIAELPGVSAVLFGLAMAMKSIPEPS